MSTANEGSSFRPPRTGALDPSVLLLLAAAVGWSVLLLICAITVPVVTVQSPPATSTASAHSPLSTAPRVDSSTPSAVVSASRRVTVRQRYGGSGIAVAAAPGAVSVLVSTLLVGSLTVRRRIFAAAAWGLSGALLAAAVVGFVTFLIGIVVVPTGALLVAACMRASAHGRRSP